MDMSKTGETSQKKILLVDDEAEFRDTLRGFLESLGYSCTEADSAQTALTLLKETHLPTVIYDALMPELDGLEFLALIKKRHSDVDVLMITESDCPYPPLRILQAGASDFLEKPFSQDQLALRLLKIEREQALKKRLYTNTITDQLTGLYNRRYFYKELKREIDRAKRQGHPMSIIMADVDRFREFNDQNDHLKGDGLLETVAWILRMSSRENVDSAFRYGADEFVMILPETDEKAALSIGNRIKAKFADTAPGGLTLSIGVAEFQRDFDIQNLVRLAEERLRQDQLRLKEPGESDLQEDLPKDSSFMRCQSCGNLLSAGSSVCKNCMADPRVKPVSEKNQTPPGDSGKEPPQSPKDRRRSPRIQIKKTFLHDGFQATIQNISREGIQIKTRTPLSVGEPLTIALALDNTIVRFGGIIVYVRSLSDGHCLAGLRFLEISDQDTRTINCFLDSQVLKAMKNNSIDEILSK
jgi:diguanylate cyclase (GGDEF)-like protein